jgi:hypothetical protein
LVIEEAGQGIKPTSVSVVQDGVAVVAGFLREQIAAILPMPGLVAEGGAFTGFTTSAARIADNFHSIWDSHAC